MLINFRFLECDGKNDKIVCKGERNLRDRKIAVSNLNIDGTSVSKKINKKKFENIGCTYEFKTDGDILDCFSI